MYIRTTFEIIATFELTPKIAPLLKKRMFQECSKNLAL